MRRRTFLKSLFVGVAMTVIPVIASPVEAEVERYQVTQDVAAHGYDNGDGKMVFDQLAGSFKQGDLVVRTETTIRRDGCTWPWPFRRIYNETQGVFMWAMFGDGFWSDRKHLCQVEGGLPTWLERV